MSRAGALPVLVCLVLVLHAGLAPARADDAEQARFHDELARRHYAARRYEDAIREFFLERDLAPNPRITFNLALCFDALHRDPEAYLLFAEYLAGDDSDAERRALAESAVARLGPRVALVSVTSDPPGATVYVDRRDHGDYGVTPLVLALTDGPHTLLLDREGHASAEVSVRAERGARVEASATLPRIEGHVEILAPDGAHVWVRDAARATVAEGRGEVRAALAPGDYEIEVRAEGHEPWRTLTRVRRDAVETVRPELSARAAPTSELTITASAAGATIEVDGRLAGFAPAVLDDVTLGAHRVRVSHPGLDDWEGDVSVEPDVRRWLTVSLAEPTETQRSELTWVVGGAAIASGIVAATLGALALESYSRFESIAAAGRAYAMGAGPAPQASLLDARSQGVTLATGADVALVATGALAVAAVILYFATEATTERESSAVIADGARTRAVELETDEGP